MSSHLNENQIKEYSTKLYENLQNEVNKLNEDMIKDHNWRMRELLKRMS